MLDDRYGPSDTYVQGVERLMQAVQELSVAKKLVEIEEIVRVAAIQLEGSDDEARLLQALDDASSIAMENLTVQDELEQRVLDRTAELEQANSEIHHLSITDELTGLLNRRGFFEAADERLDEAREAGHDCLVAFVDIDGLKHVNDTLGHVVGDTMITHLAASLRSVIREEDLIARLGGDEFCALVIAPPDGNADLPGRLRERLDRLSESGALEFRLSASVGLVSTSELPDASVDELLLKADQRMYVHKRARASRA